MTLIEPQTLLRDHVDIRPVTGATVNGDDNSPDRNAIVKLDPDHPGFRDQEYRARRNAIAQIAMTYEAGSPTRTWRLANDLESAWARAPPTRLR